MATSRRDPATSPPAFLGDELRRARVATGFTSQEALAAQLGFDRSVVGKAESGERVPSAEVLAAWCDVCHLDTDLFARLAQVARSADGPVPQWFETWIEAERQAVTLRLWSPILVPGLLQTSEYARSLFIAAGEDAERADDLVSARLDRQFILSRPDPPNIVAVLDETVLHRLIGSPVIMSDQLAHLATISDRPGISIQVVPVSNGGSAGLAGAFDIATVDDTTGTLRMEGVEDQTTDTRSLVRKAAVIFDLVRGDALPRKASRAVIEEASEQWKAK